MACTGISANILKNCDNPLKSGVNDKLLLINQDDIDSWTGDSSSPANDLIIETILLKTGTSGYIFEGQNSSVEPRAAVAKQTYTTPYEHEVTFKIFNNTASIKEQLQKLSQGKVVAIVQNNHTGDAGDCKYEIYGLETGLEVVEMERLPSDGETQGYWNVVLRNNEKSRPGTPPHSFFDTDIATSTANYEALYTL